MGYFRIYGGGDGRNAHIRKVIGYVWPQKVFRIRDYRIYAGFCFMWNCQYDYGVGDLSGDSRDWRRSTHSNFVRHYVRHGSIGETGEFRWAVWCCFWFIQHFWTLTWGLHYGSYRMGVDILYQFASGGYCLRHGHFLL
ncbi:hypothetical protein D3C73_854000 [compost metagenome]